MHVYCDSSAVPRRLSTALREHSAPKGPRRQGDETPPGPRVTRPRQLRVRAGAVAAPTAPPHTPVPTPRPLSPWEGHTCSLCAEDTPRRGRASSGPRGPALPGLLGAGSAVRTRASGPAWPTRAATGLLWLHEPRRGPAQGPATPAPPGGQTRTTGPNARPGPCRLRPNRTDPGPWPEPSTAALRKLSPNSTSSSPYLVSAPKPTDTLGLALCSPEAQGIVEGSLEEGAVGRRTRREVPAWGSLGPPGQLLPHAPGAVVPACCRGQPRLREALALSVSSRPSLTKSERNP